MKHVLFFFFLVLAAGIALGRSELFASANPMLVAGVAGLLLAASWAAAGRRRIFAASGLAACLCLGIFLAVTSHHRILEKKWEAAIAGAASADAVIEGVMTEGRSEWTDAYGRERYAFTMRTIPPGRVRVSGIGPAALPAYGERVRVSGSLAVPGGRTNPAGFDWKRFLTTRGTFAVMRAKKLEVLGPTPGFEGAVYALREKLIRRMDEALAPDAADISKAIFLGERSELDPDFRRSLVNTGTLHLFAISGFNVGFVALILFGFFTMIRVPNPARSAAVLILLILYAVLVGENSPVVRAVIMAACLIGADLMKTRMSSLQGLGAAGTVMLLVNPEEAFDPAFQLSFAAVAGLALIVPLWSSLDDIRRSRSDRRLVRWRAGLTLTALTSLAAWVTTAPILIHHFHRFSLVAPAVNVLLVPVAFVLNLLLMIFSAAACALPAAGIALSRPIEWNVHTLKLLVDVFDRLPGASWNLAAWSVWVWALFGAWWLWLALNRREVRRTLRVTLSVAVLLGLITADSARAAAVLPPMRVTYFDVGQANAALIELGATRLLIDAGRGGDADAADRVLVPYLASIGASGIDAVFITHPQFDHAGGLEGLLRTIRVGSIWINGDRSDALFFRKTLQSAHRRRIPVRALKRSDQIAGLPYSSTLTVLHPGPYFSNGGDLNERSLVLLLASAGKTLLWTGDIGERGLAELLTSRRLKPVDILQVPHHGAKTGINKLEFFAQTHPQIALISCGRENRYGHPHASTLEALAAAGSRLHRTDRQGALQLTVQKNGRSGLIRFGAEG